MAYDQAQACFSFLRFCLVFTGTGVFDAGLFYLVLKYAKEFHFIATSLDTAYVNILLFVSFNRETIAN